MYHEGDQGIARDQCVISGQSTSNQRIESWWAQYRNANCEFWITLFHELQANQIDIL